MTATSLSVPVQGGCPIPPRPEKARFFGAHPQSSRFAPLKEKEPARRFAPLRSYEAPERLPPSNTSALLMPVALPALLMSVALLASQARPARAQAPGTSGSNPLARRIPGGQALSADQPFRAPPKQGRTVLTRGRCLLHLAPGSRIRLGQPAPGTRCPAVTLEAGRLQVLAPRGAGPALHLRLGGRTVIWRHGVGRARLAGGVRGACLQRGRLEIARSSRAPARGAEPTGGKVRDHVTVDAGRCLWLDAQDEVTVSERKDPDATQTGATRAGAAQTDAAQTDAAQTDAAQTDAAQAGRQAAKARPASLGSPYLYRTKLPPLTLDLNAEVASLKARVLGEASSGSNVEGAGQSMCLETGSEGSAADLGGGGVDITKPPPPTQLRLRIRIERSTP